jgi:hypothetical protein
MIKIQANLQMPWVTGIADAVVVRSNGKEDKEVEEIELIEIKASQEFEWKDNALLQVLIYSLMTGKSWARLHLINPFRNEKVSYYFDSKKIMTLRHKVISDTLIYNTNSFMAKMYGNYKLNEPMDVTDTMFVDITRDENKKIKQISVLNMVSPIKCELVYNDYSNNSVDKNKNMEKTEKLRSESEKDNQMMLEDLDRILNSDMNKNKKKFGLVSYKKLGIQGLDITTEELIESVGYVKDEDKKYSLDIDNSLHRNLLCLSRYFTKNRFV